MRATPAGCVVPSALVLLLACGGPDVAPRDGGGLPTDAAATDAATAPTALAMRLGGNGDEEALAIAVDASGVYLLGTNGSAVMLGSVTIGERGSWVASLDEEGEVRWAIGAPFDQLYEGALALALGPDGVHVAGALGGATRFGELALAAPSNYFHAFHATLGRDGAPIAAVLAGEPLAPGIDVTARGVAVGGATWIVGSMSGSGAASARFGDRTLTWTEAGSFGFAVAARDGAVSAAHVVGSGGRAVAVGGEIAVVVGLFEGTIDLGGAPRTSVGDLDAFAVAYDGSGAPRWSTSWGGALQDAANAVLVTDDGGAYVVGSGGITAGVSAGDATLVRIDASGAIAWERSVAPGIGLAIARGADGHVYVAGRLDAATTFAGAPLGYDAAGDAFVASYAEDGTERWARAWGAGGNDTATGVAVDAAGRVWVVGSFERTVSFEGTELESAQSSTRDAFVLRLDPP